MNSITLTPADPSVADGETTQLTATLEDQNGQAFSSPPAGVTVEWSSADEAVASVNGSGMATGEHPGAAEITVTAAGKSASTDLTVTQVATALAIDSGNGGASWTETQITNYTSSYWNAQHPSLLRTPDGALHAIWQDRRGNGEPQRVRVSRSTDGGATWSEPVQVSDEVMLGEGRYNSRGRPSLAVGSGGTLYAAWADERQGRGGSLDSRNWDIYLSRSTDGGASWSVNERVNDMPEILEQRSAALAVGTDGVLVVWEDQRGEKQELLHRLVP